MKFHIDPDYFFHNFYEARQGGEKPLFTLVSESYSEDNQDETQESHKDPYTSSWSAWDQYGRGSLW